MKRIQSDTNFTVIPFKGLKSPNIFSITFILSCNLDILGGTYARAVNVFPTFFTKNKQKSRDIHSQNLPDLTQHFRLKTLLLMTYLEECANNFAGRHTEPNFDRPFLLLLLLLGLRTTSCNVHGQGCLRVFRGSGSIRVEPQVLCIENTGSAHLSYLSGSIVSRILILKCFN